MSQHISKFSVVWFTAFHCILNSNGKVHPWSWVIFPTYAVFQIHHFSLGKKKQTKIILRDRKKVSFTEVIFLETDGKTNCRCCACSTSILITGLLKDESHLCISPTLLVILPPHKKSRESWYSSFSLSCLLRRGFTQFSAKEWLFWLCCLQQTQRHDSIGKMNPSHLYFLYYWTCRFF